MSKRRVSEPGYRYAEERGAYLALSPAGRQKVKAVMEEVWAGKGCDALRKGRLPCPNITKQGSIAWQKNK